MAQASKPWSRIWRNAACRRTGSGVVSPVYSSRSGSPTPSVPTTPQRRPTRVSACAIHQALLVLPLVPVTATTSIKAVGAPWKAAAMAPVLAFRSGSEATRASVKPKASTPSASTRQVAAPAASAWATNPRPSCA
jgi:hypothetical protein